MRIVDWKRGAPLRVWIEGADLRTHRGEIIPPQAVLGGTLEVCEPNDVEPPTVLSTRSSPVAVVYDGQMGEYGATVIYGTDLNGRDAVRLVLQLQVDDGNPAQRVLDAVATFTAPQGRW